MPCGMGEVGDGIMPEGGRDELLDRQVFIIAVGYGYQVGSSGEGADFGVGYFRRGVICFRGGLFRCFLLLQACGGLFFFPDGKNMCERQVHKPYGDMLPLGIADSLPFGGVFGEWVKAGVLRVIGLVHQYGHRWFQRFMAGPRKDAVSFRRAFHQHNIGLQRFQEVFDVPGRAGSMVPDSKYMNRHDYTVRLLQIAAGTVYIFPLIAGFDNSLQVFLPHQFILHRVFHYGADDTGGEVGGGEAAVAEVSGEG